jgi:hypothetical protein
MTYINGLIPGGTLLLIKVAASTNSKIVPKKRGPAKAGPLFAIC